MRHIFEIRETIAGNVNVSRRVLLHLHGHLHGNAQAAKGCEHAIEGFGAEALDGLLLGVLSMWDQLKNSRPSKRFLESRFMAICSENDLVRAFLLRKGILNNPFADSRKWMGEVYCKLCSTDPSKDEQRAFSVWREDRANSLDESEQLTFLPVIRRLDPELALGWEQAGIKHYTKVGAITQSVSLLNASIERYSTPEHAQQLVTLFIELLPRGVSGKGDPDIRRDLGRNPVRIAKDRHEEFITACDLFCKPRKNHHDYYVEALMSSALRAYVKEYPGLIGNVDGFASDACVDKYWVKALCEDFLSPHTQRHFLGLDFASKPATYRVAFLLQCMFSRRRGLPNWAEELFESLSAEHYQDLDEAEGFYEFVTGGSAPRDSVTRKVPTKPSLPKR